jgi:formylglycine-generating enzyme required for sulfatase activity
MPKPHGVFWNAELAAKWFTPLWFVMFLWSTSGCGKDIYFGPSCGGRAGPEPVSVGDFCIDSTEVSRAEYGIFLASVPLSSAQPSECDWNDHFEPQEMDGTASPPYAPGEAGLPAVNVDWCDARAYCEWAGKQLCGRKGGGPLTYAERADASQSEWFAACSRNGTRAYPYGDTFDVNACAVRGTYHAVGSQPTCTGGFDGIFDLIGNVWEWENACEGDPSLPAEMSCSRRGGALDVTEADWACRDNGDGVRRLRQADIGFRCCSR